MSTPVLNVNFNMPAADLKQWAMDRTTWILGKVELTFEKFSELAGSGSSMPEMKKTTPPAKKADEAKVAVMVAAEGVAGATSSSINAPEGRRGLSGILQNRWNTQGCNLPHSQAPHLWRPCT